MNSLECIMMQCVGWRIGEDLARAYPDLGLYLLALGGLLGGLSIMFRRKR